jgi:hypothetical protein
MAKSLRQATAAVVMAARTDNCSMCSRREDTATTAAAAVIAARVAVCMVWGVA